MYNLRFVVLCYNFRSIFVLIIYILMFISALIINICIASLSSKMYRTDLRPRFFHIPDLVPGPYFVSLLEDMMEEHLGIVSDYGPDELLPCIYQTLVAMDAADELPDLTDFLRRDYDKMLGDHYRLLFDFANNHTFYTD